MKKLLCFALLFVLSSLAFGQVNVPPCDPNNPPPNCTDYFGVGNWANSPVPAGGVTGFTVVASGSGYVNPVVVITDATGTNATAGAVTLTAGAVTGVAAGSPGSGYIAPQVTIVDVGTGGTLAAPTCGPAPMPACGSGALVTAVLGGTLTGGMPKFVLTDLLPDLKSVIATADVATFPGSDFYVIGLKQYSQVMHSSLPATTLRGYCQLTPPTYTTCVAGQPSYLGPVILAQKNRPVRVLFVNMLPTGAGGDLFIPTDTTYMGAGINNNNASSYTQNRATLHLHGGATPWISDGTPHQWTVPVGEVTPNQKGDSTQNVPDMWFDATGNLIAACAGQLTCATTGATNDPGQGKMTFYWTNQQGGRLMFYHDHAYGITRLNVYAGEAAGYLLYDPVEESTLLSAGVPGTLATNNVQTSADLAHLIPLVIQDKTFVPGQPQLMVQDPTWAGNFGATPLSTTANGDLWFPHVYMTNQNPADPTTANAFGRWDYGAWFFPPMTQLSAASPQSATTVPCTSAAFPNQAVQCPITPNPSGTPEGFMDTPVLNGKAYPVLHVAPAAYRFKILSAGNDRSWNLSWFVADATGKDVAMLQAAPPPANALPLCSAINPVAVPPLVIGLATALVDGNGNPINGTGLPAGCWPNYGPQQGIPAPQTMWSAEGAAGGAPDPRNAGPAWIQIGTEGGLLPAPVVIPPTPVNFELNTRSITITSVGVHGLWLGPAERADVIVDFSKFSGKTLILYNDAPAPAPAIDVRLDYFTGDPDQSPVGGAPSTQPGYGPNTRTLMQVVVDGGAANTVPFSMSQLKATLPGLFAQTQPPIIVPEPTYPPASGGYSATQAYSGIQDYTLTYYPLGSTTPVTNTDERKAIQELFTTDYGRMNATLGTELPLVNFTTQTTIPLAYIDPPTEILNPGAVQLWKITHNGVDSHFIHFHLFNVQVINRVGWDGSMRPPDPNELGWKDTVRMNPLEDILVGLQPIQPIVPWPLRDSYRLLDVTQPAGSNCTVKPPSAPADAGTCSPFTNINPYTNIGVQTPNAVNNFGWEYVWHCHILGHEENDMMRAMSFQVPPEAPSNLVATAAVAPATGLNLSWTDNSASETGFTLQRATDAAFTLGVTSVTVLPIAGTTDSNGQGLTFGGTQTFNDAAATTPPYFYRVQAYKPDANYWTPGANLTSAWSNTATVGLPLSVSPAALTFATQGTGTTSPSQTVTLSNTSAAQVAFSSITTSVADYAASTTCVSPLPANSSCVINVTFTPALAGVRTGTLTIANSSPNPNLTVSLTGTGSGTPVLTITASNATMKYGAVVPTITASYNPPNPVLTTAPTCTAAATSTSAVGTYQTSCSGAVAAGYTIVYVRGTLAVTPVPLTIWGPANSLAVGSPIPTNFTPSYVGLVAGDTPAIFTAPTVPPIVGPTCTTTANSLSPIGTYPITCAGAVDPNYTISYVAGTLIITKGTLTITAPSPSMTYGGPLPALTPTMVAVPTAVPPVGLVTPATCTTTATVTSPVGTYPVTCSGAVDPNYNITYVAGTLTVTAKAASVTPNPGTKVYGTADPVPLTTGTLTGFTPADLALITATYSRVAGETVAGSPYPISATLSPAAVLANYTITYNTANFTITPAAASVTPIAASKAYGTADPVPLTTGTLTGFTPADLALITATYSRAAGETVAGSPYPISATLSPAAVLANYTITYNTANFTITAVPVTASVTANSMTYNKATAATIASCTLTGVSPADVGNVTCSAASASFASANVGTGIAVTASGITLGGTAAGNYSLSSTTATTTANITPATVTASVTAANKPYDGTTTASIASCTLTGVLTGDVVACSAASASFASANVGTGIAVTASGITLSGAAAGNYSLPSTTATTTANITPALVTATAGSYTGVYNGASHSPSACALTGAYTVGLTCANNPASVGPGVGAGTVTPTVSGTVANFTVTSGNGSWSITQAPLTITASSPTMIYGGAVPAITPGYVGFVGTDTPAISLAPQPTCSTTATSTSHASPPTYPSNCSGAAAANYTISYVPGVVTINLATTTTTITSNTPNPSVVGQAVTVGFRVAPQFTGTPSGTVTVRASTGETCNGTLTGGAGSCPITFATAVDRTLTATYNGNGNFVASPASASVNQSVRDFTITVAPTSRTRTGAGTVTYTLTLAAVNGLTGNVALSCSGYTPLANSCVVTPASRTLPGGPLTATATVTTRGGAPGRGTFTMTFRGNYGAGLLVRTTTATLTVN